MDTKPHFNPQPDPYAHPDLDALRDTLSRVVARVKLDAIANGEYQCRIDDAHGRAIAILVGKLDCELRYVDDHDPDGFDFTVTGTTWDGGWRVLPVRPQPQPFAHSFANTLTVPHDHNIYVGDPITLPARTPDTATYRHRHFHFHAYPDDALRAEYHHTHWHTHPGDDRDEHGPGRDGDAALHDHGFQHGAAAREHQHTGDAPPDQPA